MYYLWNINIWPRWLAPRPSEAKGAAAAVLALLPPRTLGPPGEAKGAAAAVPAPQPPRTLRGLLVLGALAGAQENLNF